MLSNKKIDSSINLDEKLGLYKVKLPGICRWFESVYFNFDGNRKIYGGFKVIKIEDNIDWNNKLIGVTHFYDYNIICILDLDNLSSSYHFVYHGEFLSFNILGEKYFCFVYKNYDNQVLFYTDFESDEYSIDLLDKKITLKNNIFGTVIFEKKIDERYYIEEEKLYSSSEEKFDSNIIIPNKYLDIADFYIFKDYFVKNSGFSEFIKSLEEFNKLDNISVTTTKYDKKYYPKLKINIKIKNIKDKKALSQISILLLSFYPENTLSYIINKDEIKDFFNPYITDVSQFDFDKISLDFKLPDNILIGNKKFNKFKIDLLKIRYYLYHLKITREELDDEQNDTVLDSEHIKIMKNRIEMSKKGIDKVIFKYENDLNIFLEKII